MRGVSDFGDQVDYAAKPPPKVWRLMIWDAPQNLAALLGRHGFRPTKKNKRNWWRIFDPANDREAAATIRIELRDAGLKGSWGQVTASVRQIADGNPPRPVTKKFREHVSRSNREGFGGALNARPIAGTWRRKTRHR